MADTTGSADDGKGSWIDLDATPAVRASNTTVAPTSYDDDIVFHSIVRPDKKNDSLKTCKRLSTLEDD